VPSLVPPWAPGRQYDATVSSGFGSPRHGHAHRGLDIMYRRDRADPEVERLFPPAVRQADGFASTKNYFLPPGTPCVAARAGEVWSVLERSDGGGWSVVLDHGKPWATYYTHLISTVLAPHEGGKRVGGGDPQRVAAGETIGAIGGNLSDSERVRHLHFEAWHGGFGSARSADAWTAGVMKTWERERWAPSQGQLLAQARG
jgi:murein DD-endopeptidase MepM/ murein hydrolase activator NlpD